MRENREAKGDSTYQVDVTNCVSYHFYRIIGAFTHRRRFIEPDFAFSANIRCLNGRSLFSSFPSPLLSLICAHIFAMCEYSIVTSLDSREADWLITDGKNRQLKIIESQKIADNESLFFRVCACARHLFAF